jgi:diphthine synthase
MAERKGRLVFVGLGLHDQRGITLRGLDEMSRADVVFAEFYTANLRDGSLEALSEESGRPVQLLDRKAVEAGDAIISAARDSRVVLLVAGDPMTATTHVDLRLRAEREGIPTEVVQGVSVMTAVPGLLGLQHYKFGRTTTLPFPQEGYSPTSPYEVVEENLSRGQHSLVLLDIDAEGGKYMTATEGLHLLLDMERRVGHGAIGEKTLVCVVARAGSPDAAVRAGTLGRLASEDFGPPLHSIVVPGKLHFLEQEALEMLAGMKD